MKMTKKMAYTWSGYVGTVSPFGKKLLAAGIDTHRATNMPIEMKQLDEDFTPIIKDITNTKIILDGHPYTLIGMDMVADMKFDIRRNPNY